MLTDKAEQALASGGGSAHLMMGRGYKPAGGAKLSLHGAKACLGWGGNRGGGFGKVGNGTDTQSHTPKSLDSSATGTLE